MLNIRHNKEEVKTIAVASTPTHYRVGISHKSLKENTMEKTAKAVCDQAYTAVIEKARKMIAGVTDVPSLRVTFKKLCVEHDVPATSDRHNIMHLFKDLARKGNFATGDAVLEDIHRLLKGNKGRGLESNGGAHHVLAMYEAGMKMYRPAVKKAPKAKKVKAVVVEEVKEAVNG
jgi:hypothetical protein